MEQLCVRIVVHSGSGGGGASEEGATNTGSPAYAGGAGGDGTALCSWRTDSAVTYADSVYAWRPESLQWN